MDILFWTNFYVTITLVQAFCLDILKKTQGEKNSKLKEITENSSSNPKKLALFCKFLDIFI